MSNSTGSITRREMIVGGAFLAASTLAIPGKAGQASQQQTPIKRTELLSQPLADVTGKEVTVITVEFAPGASSQKHQHPGASVFAYVLEGSITSQLEGQEPVTYKQGQIWSEVPGQIHLVARNASDTHPAKLLVFFINEKGQPVTVPLK